MSVPGTDTVVTTFVGYLDQVEQYFSDTDSAGNCENSFFCNIVVLITNVARYIKNGYETIKVLAIFTKHFVILLKVL